ncbi:MULTISPECIES: winged helix-turn-helix transcriptional regulator [Chryseobacterium]|jgi:DNA-binding HxlR family transcriptional regulator|uniref:Winged helix-turn-helix transcriptional regulator n=1 Tax=Chryseobacterium nepalense TaxID=1854498 RepID=A0ABY4K5P9_9FLAO|nr:MULTISPECIES: winged helix-turn-helix transcriptional regulator [Chryseobacterium]MEA1848837.1 winged helix-turn-helix transcriptional regulator [Chryseobacterium sp. MHB01]MEC5174981.1 DNA-binding HxlR family transcriptional regulator [Chryseobacterium nepalense]UPQ76077.1 winged helix-turn-helix transcriptional regulator [Chryseobacterium nepalense]
MYERKIPLTIDCGLHLTREILNGKWKPAILNAISMNIKRPSEIGRTLPDATRRVLSAQLKELEEHGIIEKKIYPQLPPKVEYSLSEIGWSLMPIIDAMNIWGDQNRDFLEKVIAKDPKITKMSKSPCELIRRETSDEK